MSTQYMKFPIVIRFLGSHGLENSAVEGRDYYRFKVIFLPDQLPMNVPFEIIASCVKV